MKRAVKKVVSTVAVLAASLAAFALFMEVLRADEASLVVPSMVRKTLRKEEIATLVGSDRTLSVPHKSLAEQFSTLRRRAERQVTDERDLVARDRVAAAQRAQRALVQEKAARQKTEEAKALAASGMPLTPAQREMLRKADEEEVDFPQSATAYTEAPAERSELDISRSLSYEMQKIDEALDRIVSTTSPALVRSIRGQSREDASSLLTCPAFSFGPGCEANFCQIRSYLPFREYLLDRLEQRDELSNWFRTEVLARVAQALYEEHIQTDIRSRTIVADHHSITDMPTLVQLQLMMARFTDSLANGDVMIIDDSELTLEEVRLLPDYACPPLAPRAWECIFAVSDLVERKTSPEYYKARAEELKGAAVAPGWLGGQNHAWDHFVLRYLKENVAGKSLWVESQLGALLFKPTPSLVEAVIRKLSCSDGSSCHSQVLERLRSTSVQSTRLARWPVKPIMGALIRGTDLQRCAYRAKMKGFKDGGLRQRLTEQESCRPAIDDYVESILEMRKFYFSRTVVLISDSEVPADALRTFADLDVVVMKSNFSSAADQLLATILLAQTDMLLGLAKDLRIPLKLLIGMKGEVPPFTLVDKPFILPGSDCFQQMEARSILKARKTKARTRKEASQILDNLADKQQRMADTFKPVKLQDHHINFDSSRGIKSKRLSSLQEQRQRVEAKLAAQGLVSTPPGKPGTPEMLRKTESSIEIIFQKPESVVQIEDYEVLVLNTESGEDAQPPVIPDSQNAEANDRVHTASPQSLRLRGTSSKQQDWRDFLTPSKGSPAPERPEALSEPSVRDRLQTPTVKASVTFEFHDFDLHSTDQRVTIGGLQPSTEYKVIVSARSLGGYSEFSDPIIIRTEVGAPGAVTDVVGEQMAIDLSHLQLSWQPPETHGDPWIWYQLQLIKGGQPYLGDAQIEWVSRPALDDLARPSHLPEPTQKDTGSGATKSAKVRKKKSRKSSSLLYSPPPPASGRVLVDQIATTWQDGTILVTDETSQCRWDSLDRGIAIKPNDRYGVRVRAINHQGEGEYSHWLVFDT
eukprot:scaffold1265_cov366-Prasinococcus_capsulatus_cf.AAC.6